MKQFVARLLKAVHSFTIADFAIFKICLLSLGILLGVYFVGFFEKYITFVACLVVVSAVYILGKVFTYYKHTK